MVFKVNKLEVYYDAECELCIYLMDFLKTNIVPQLLHCTPYQEKECNEELMLLNPQKELVIRVNSERYYQGGEAWVICLLQVKRYHWLGKLLNFPVFFPFVKQLARWIALRRRAVNKFFNNKQKIK